jgi:hypothetical protein
VRAWIDDGYAAKRRRDTAARKARSRQNGRSLGHPQAHPLSRMRRIQALQEIGLSYVDIAAVMRLDFGDELTDEQVRYALQNNTVPRIYRRRLREAATA